MTARSKLIEKIVTKIGEISEENLKQVLSYVSEIEKLTEQQQSILSYAGSWSDIDQELLDNLTTNLNEARLEESDLNKK